MKYRLSHTLLLGAIATGAVLAQIPSAEAWSGYERHDRWQHHGWDDRWDGPRLGYRPPVVIRSYYTPAPVYYDARPAYVPTYAPAQTVTRTVCRERDTTLPMLLGGAGGGVVGSTIGKGHGRTAATITGALIGATLVSNASRGEDCYQQVFETAPVGAPVNFQTQQVGYNYTITPTRDYRTDGRYCREYQAVATVGGHIRETYGTACRQPDGQWEVIN